MGTQGKRGEGKGGERAAKRACPQLCGEKEGRKEGRKGLRLTLRRRRRPRSLVVSAAAPPRKDINCFHCPPANHTPTLSLSAAHRAARPRAFLKWATFFWPRKTPFPKPPPLPPSSLPFFFHSQLVRAQEGLAEKAHGGSRRTRKRNVGSLKW